MAHPQQQVFVQKLKRAFPSYFSGMKVMEVGSLDINGSIRTLFTDCDYTGLDVAAGPGVDVVCQGQDFAAPDASFDVTISCEVMEHNPFWKETFQNMIRLCKPSGMVIMTCASLGRPEHGTTRTTKRDSPRTVDAGWEYYRNLTAQDFRAVFDMNALFSAWMFCYDFTFCDLFFAGIKRGKGEDLSAQMRLNRIKRQYYRKNLLAWQPLRKQVLIRVFGEERYMSGPLRLFSPKA